MIKEKLQSMYLSSRDRRRMKLAEWREARNSTKEFVLGTTKMVKGIYGVPLWEINNQFKKLAKRKNLEEKVGEKIIIPLPMKKSSEPLTSMELKQVEEKLYSLEGFELLQLSHFALLKPTYKEQKLFHHVSRKVEIHIESF
ncbi:hypothetical protein JOC86_003129 [Bacillus pakistanensis]|uniref:Uncharacterized protein n=1 Tax=Rossellomorea pakistanensis TaxID=992288 RepID=A0ABS2NFD6_9BACI|nr:hypothetical protein [Bacillus pakistanensis]